MNRVVARILVTLIALGALSSAPALAAAADVCPPVLGCYPHA